MDPNTKEDVSLEEFKALVYPGYDTTIQTLQERCRRGRLWGSYKDGKLWRVNLPIYYREKMRHIESRLPGASEQPEQEPEALSEKLSVAELVQQKLERRAHDTRTKVH